MTDASDAAADEIHRRIVLSRIAYVELLAALDAPMIRNELLATQSRLARRLELAD